MLFDDEFAQCKIPGCVECEDGLCILCANITNPIPFFNRDFRLDNGRCYLPADKIMAYLGEGLVVALFAIICFSALANFCIMLCRRRRSHAPDVPDDQKPLNSASYEDEQRRRSAEAIAHGLLSWLQRQMRDWEHDDKPERYNPFTTNVSQKYIMGVGLPLFYGFKVLVICSSALTAVTLFIVQRSSGLEPKMAMIVDMLEHQKTNEEVMDALQGTALENYAQSMFFAMGVLFVLQYILAILHLERQMRFVPQFDAGNSCMHDFTVHLRGLPRNLTDEGRLKQIVEDQFDCEGEVLGVSICYDLSQPQVSSKIFDMVEHRMVLADVAFHDVKRDSDLVKAGWGYPETLAKPEQLDTAKDRETFREMWDQGDLESSGHAFIVFNSKSILKAVESKYRGIWVQSQITPTEAEAKALTRPNMLSEKFAGNFRDTSQVKGDKKQRTFRCIMEDMFIGGTSLFAGARVYDDADLTAGKPITVESCACIVDDTLEPLSTMWFNFGTHEAKRRLNGWRYFLTLGLAWLAISLFVYFPLFYFFVSPCGLAKFQPSVMASQFQGILLALAGNILGVVNWNSVCSIGYYSKREQDEKFVMFSTFVNFFNSICFIGAGLAYYIMRGFNKVNLVSLSANNAENFVRERQLFDAYFGMLMPGWLFAGVLTGKLMGWFMPLIQNYLLTTVVFSSKLLPDPIRKVLTAIIPWNPTIDGLSARQAEHIFEPPEVALAWEYNMYIVTPCVSMVALFFMSPRTWWVFALLGVWALFMFCLHRYPTLVMSKKHMTGYKVDLLACKLWGFPLAMISAAFGYWGVRCDRFGNHGNLGSYWVVLFLFFLGLVVHRLAVEVLAHRGFNTVDMRDQPYSAVQKQLRYTWFNTNPVHILKSCYYREKMGHGVDDSHAFVPFEFGKEYLQIFAQDQAFNMMDWEATRERRSPLIKLPP